MSETAVGIHKDGQGATVIDYGDESIQVWSGLGMDEADVTDEMLRVVLDYMRAHDSNVSFRQTFAELYEEARASCRG